MRTQLLSAFLPVVLFWANEKFWGLKAALIAGCISAPIDLAWEKIREGRITFLTLFSNILVVGLGAVSFFMNSGVAFKLQPAIMELIMAGMMLVFRLRGEPFMLRLFRDSPMLDPARRESVLANPVFSRKIRAFDTRLLVFFIFHGFAIAWAAVYSTTNVWALLKGVLFYVLLVLVAAPMYKRERHGTSDGASERVP